MTTLAQISETQAQKATTANENFATVSPAGIYGRKASTTSGLTWGYYGGIFPGNYSSIADGTLSLTGNATNYIEADTATGALSVNTSGWTASGKKRIYSVTTNASAVTAYTDYRTVLDIAAAALAGANTWTGVNTFDEDVIIGSGSPSATLTCNGPVTVNSSLTINGWIAGPVSFTGQVTFDEDVVIGSGSPTATLTCNGTVTINAGTLNGVVIGGSTPLAVTGTVVTGNSFVPNSATVPTNGMFLPAANVVGIATNSTERARTTAGGYSKWSDSGSYNNATGTFHEILSSAAVGADAPTLRIANTHATNPGGIGIVYTADPNGTANEFIYLVGNGNVRGNWRSNGGIANYSANDVNLSTREVKTGIRRYSEGELERFIPMLADLDFGVWKYKDQTHDDWNHGPTAEGVRDAFLKHGLTEAVNSVIDEFSPGKLGIVTRDLDNIVMATLIHSDHKQTEDIESLKAWKGRAETALAERGITIH